MIGPTNANGNVVTVGTAQTISGEKTFSTIPTVKRDNAGLALYTTKFAITDTVSVNYNPHIIQFMDKNGAYCGGLVNRYYATSNDHRVNLEAYGKDNALRQLNLYAGDGFAYATAPNRTYNSSNTSDIVTIGSLQSSTDVVHRSGNETIAGQKTFTNATIHTADIQTTSYMSFNMSQGGYRDIVGQDTTNGVRATFIRQNADAVANSIVLQAFKPGDSTYRSSQIMMLSTTSDGTSYVTAPYRSVYNSANTSEVVTIGSLQSSTDVVHTSGNETIAGNKTFEDSVLIKQSSGETSLGVYDTRYTREDQVTSTYVNRVYFYDNNATNRVGMMGKSFGPKNTNTGRMSTYMGMTNLYSSSQYSAINVYTDYLANSDTYEKYATTYARDYANASSSQTGGDILTKWHLEQAITIGGDKTWSGSQTINNNIQVQSTNYPRVFLKDTNAYAGDSTIGELGSVCGLDKNGNRWGEFRLAKSATDVMSAIVRAYCVSSTNLSASLIVNMDNAGDSWATAPSPIPSRNAIRNITISDQAPSGGNNGDIWIQYEA